MGKGPMWGDQEGRERLKDGSRQPYIINKPALSPKPCVCKRRRVSSGTDGGYIDDHCNKKGGEIRGEGRGRGRGRGLRVVQIFNPVFVETDVHNFPSLVQKLTGKSEHNCCCRGSLEAMARAYHNSTTGRDSNTVITTTGSSSKQDQEHHHQFFHHEELQYQTTVQEEQEANLMTGAAAAAAAASASSPSSSPSNYNSSPPSSSSSSYNSSSVASLLNRCATLKGGRWLLSSSTSELDLWAGLVSETPLPDITLLPPLL